MKAEPARVVANRVVIDTPQRYCRDADDERFIHTALAASAPWLVTGDQDLLVIPAGLGVRILAPAETLQRAGFCQ